ncbi:methyltransferase, FkbM family [bacterium JGI 053]|nr:methyltransferase, FkbM family [bacterium JGI 053]
MQPPMPDRAHEAPASPVPAHDGRAAADALAAPAGDNGAIVSGMGSAPLAPRSPAFRAGKAVRDGFADALGAAAARWEPAERAVAAAGRALHARWRPFDLLYRRTVETLAARRFANGPVFRRMRLGAVEVWGDVTHFSFGHTYFHRDGYELESVALFETVLRPGCTVVDIGANHGYFTVLAAALVGAGGRVEAFEPNPAVADALAEVLARNDVAARVPVHRVALADREGHAEFFVSVSPVNDGLSSLLASADALEHGVIRADHSIRVPTQTYDAFAEGAGLERVDLVKIDVEGAEAMVLRGMARTLAERPPLRIVCETTPGDEAMRILTARGYTVRPLDNPRSGYGNYLFTAPDAT